LSHINSPFSSTSFPSLNPFNNDFKVQRHQFWMYLDNVSYTYPRRRLGKLTTGSASRVTFTYVLS
jgi:hypothetical protein